MNIALERTISVFVLVFFLLGWIILIEYKFTFCLQKICVVELLLAVMVQLLEFVFLLFQMFSRCKLDEFHSGDWTLWTAVLTFDFICIGLASLLLLGNNNSIKPLHLELFNMSMHVQTYPTYFLQAYFIWLCGLPFALFVDLIVVLIEKKRQENDL